MLDVESHKNTKIRFLEGDVCLKELNETELLKQWKDLLDKSKSAAVFQSPDFVIPWIKENKSEFSPVFVLLYSESELVGLLALGRKIDSKTGRLSKHLVGAGHFYALYQNWILLDGYETVFWEKGLLGLIKHIPGCEINLKSLPNLTAYQGIASAKIVKNYSVIEKYHNPILSFESDDYQKIINKRHFKAKFNRVNKSGNLYFESLTSMDRLLMALDQIEVFHNLRQGAAFNKTPFPLDKDERNIFIEWFKKGLLHATVLWLDDKLIGAVIMIKDGNNTVHLAGLITYSPFYGRYSPGLVHLYLLVLRLKEEGFQFLKLSPGYDSYKERFSNDNEELYELLISGNRIALMKRKLRVFFRKIILKKGIRPMEVSVWIDKNRAAFKNKLFRFKKGNAHKNVNWSHILGKIDPENEVKILDDFELKVLDLTHLLLVNDCTFEVSRWEFLQDALKRLEENQLFFTLTDKNRLILCVWYNNPDVVSKKINKSEFSYNSNDIFAALDVDFNQLKFLK